jgi:hypothetical protein
VAGEVLDLGLDEAIEARAVDHHEDARPRAAAGGDVDVHVHRLSVHLDRVHAGHRRLAGRQ